LNRLSKVHERYRRQTDRQTDGRQHIANVNVSSRSLKTTSEVGDDDGNGDGRSNWLAGDGGRDRSGRGRHTLSGRGARVYIAHRGWLCVVTGISAASTEGVLMRRNCRPTAPFFKGHH